MGRRTQLFELHRELNARMVDFAGWDMPVQYSSQIGEHHAVRRGAGVFDVSHMGILDLEGDRARACLQRLLANDVARLTAPGQALYSCMLAEDGGILDDLIVYSQPAGAFRIVVNAGTRDADLDWMRAQAAPFGVRITERTDLAMLAVQGPEARARVAQLLPAPDAAGALALARHACAAFGAWFIARTGYTGEDGFEIMLPGSEAVRLWRELNAHGVASCGLGARDTLRLEAGLCLYGSDMDRSTHPFESNLGWSVAFDPAGRDFIGRPALERIRARGSERELVGLVLEQRGVLRRQQRVLLPGGAAGEVTSGTFSPTLERSIALARVPAGSGATEAQVEIRGRALTARIVRPPFVPRGAASAGATQTG